MNDQGNQNAGDPMGTPAVDPMAGQGTAQVQPDMTKTDVPMGGPVGQAPADPGAQAPMPGAADMPANTPGTTETPAQTPDQSGGMQGGDTGQVPPAAPTV